MNNLEAAWSLDEIADLLEIKGENPYRAKAYKKAAASIANLQQNIRDLYQDGSLRDIPGVGKAIAEKLEEMINTGRCSLLEQLRQEIPPVFRSISQLPGLSLRVARIIYQHTDIKNLEQLEEAARKRIIRTLPGLGPKTELNLIRGLELLKTQRDTSPINLALASAEILVGFLSSLNMTRQVALSGSIRRGKDTVQDVDIVASVDNIEHVLENLSKHPHIKEIISSTHCRVEALTWLGVKVDIILVKEKEFTPVLFRTTGSKEFYRELTDFASDKGCRLTETEVIVGERPVPVKDEKEIFKLLGISYIPPEIREGSAVIKAAREDSLPCLIELSDIQGDLHCHSLWSDGTHSIEELVQEAISRGYKYLAITDHSKSLAIANGLSWDRLQEQWKEIEKLQYEYSPFKIFKGLEVDILKDGALDFNEEVLSQLDIVIASVHSGFRQDLETMTSRMISAIRNPYVDIIAHPTGRILGKRPPYNLDMDRFIEEAAKTGTILEINASPDRLDLSAENARRAKDNGIMLVINTDAHDKTRLQDISFGVTTARRGWLEKSNVLNAHSGEELEEILRERRRKALLK